VVWYAPTASPIHPIQTGRWVICVKIDSEVLHMQPCQPHEPTKQQRWLLLQDKITYLKEPFSFLQKEEVETRPPSA